MCIIVVKPANVSLPSDEIFANCFENNDDGAGMMIAHGGKVHGDKGFMTLRAFNEQLENYKNVYGDLKSHAMVFHFRIGTHGTNNPANTHPFPLDDYKSYSRFKELHWVADQGFAHNGVMYQFSSHTDVKKYDVSDTMVFGRRVAALLADSFNIPTNTYAQFVLDKMVSGSRFAYMDGEGNIATFGTFTTENGIMYSNSSYKAPVRKYTSYVYNYDDVAPWWNQGKYGNNTSKSSSKSNTPGYISDYYNGKTSVPQIPGANLSLTDAEKKKREKLAEDAGLTILKKDLEVLCDDDIDYSLLNAYEFAYNMFEIWYWSKKDKDWAPYEAPFGGFILYDPETEEIVHDSFYDDVDYNSGSFYHENEDYHSEVID